ncbi:hypothetical protein RFI_05355, partial [Reticulomyxa filosa]
MINDALAKEAMAASKNAALLQTHTLNKPANSEEGKVPGEKGTSKEDPSASSLCCGITLLVEEKNIGFLIGKGGEGINHIRKVTGANIAISSQVLRNSSEKTVDITGTKETTNAAIAFVIHRLLENSGYNPTRLPYDPMSDILPLH